MDIAECHSYLVKGTISQTKELEYCAVYNRSYYEQHNPELSLHSLSDEECFRHFLTFGMKEGRSASNQFHLNAYRANYPELEERYGGDYAAYYKHYLTDGMAKGWSGAFDVYQGVCYRDVFDVEYYKTVNPDVAAHFGDNDASYIEHFVEYGMNEGRMAKQSFDVYAYQRRYDKRFGKSLNCLKDYFIDYMETDQKIRISGACSVYGDTDYLPVYSYAYYKAQNNDIRAKLGTNATAYLKHFVEYGMQEGRDGNDRFHVQQFRAEHPELVEKLGDYLPPYYLEYIRMEEEHG